MFILDIFDNNIYKGRPYPRCVPSQYLLGMSVGKQGNLSEDGRHRESNAGFIDFKVHKTATENSALSVK